MADTISPKDLIRALNQSCEACTDEDLLDEAEYDTNNECYYLDAMPRNVNLPAVNLGDAGTSVSDLSPNGTHVIYLAGEGDWDGSSSWTTHYLVHHRGLFAQLTVSESDYCDDETDASWTLSDITTDPASIRAAVGGTLDMMRNERAAALKAIEDSAGAASRFLDPSDAPRSHSPAPPRHTHAP